MSDATPAQTKTGRVASAQSLIAPQPRVGRLGAVVISLAFAALATPVVMSDETIRLSGITIEEGEPAPVTLRVAQFSGGELWSKGTIVATRGHAASAEATAIAAERSRQLGYGGWIAYFAALFLLALLFTSYLRRSHRGTLFRTQVVTLLLLLAAGIAVKVLMLLTTVSPMVVPVAFFAIVAALVVDTSAGVATGMTASVVCGLMVPFDVGTIAVLATQSLAAVFGLSRGPGEKRRIVLAGVVSALAAGTVLATLAYLSRHSPLLSQFDDPLRSPVLAACAGGLLSMALTVFGGKSTYQYLLGDITKNRLVELADLSNPLLKQIADKSPGTWQHSLAMANMAEVAANAIGANGRLVRVGAYYHDLGKSLQSNYFIENLQAGESSPHDRLPPEVSCDAIFAHVTEGVRLGRKAGLPERIIDFMHMHHGDGLLEYFWAKCQEQGNPNNLTAEDFRYPGVRPQSPETAILAICDAVEAASRTLKQPDTHSIRNLVQRIVYGKLHLGQLDDSGLTVAELRRISDSLMETIKHAYHGRIEYPWQREQRENAEEDQNRDRAPSEAAVPARQSVQMSATQRIIDEPRLDSLDVPRPYWREVPVAKSDKMPQADSLALGPTQHANAIDDQPETEDQTVHLRKRPPRAPIDDEPQGAEKAMRLLSDIVAAADLPAAPPPADHVQRASATIVTSASPDDSTVRHERMKTPPPPPPTRSNPNTIPLLPSDEVTVVRSEPAEEFVKHSLEAANGKRAQTHARAQTADDELEPGTLVIGPPPATHTGTDVTVRRARAQTPDDGSSAN